MGTFTVIKTDKQTEDIKELHRLGKLNLMWANQYRSHLSELDKKFQKGIKGSSYNYNRISFSGAKFISARYDYLRFEQRLKFKEGIESKEQSYDDVMGDFLGIESVLTFMQCMTYRDFITTFPITKEYDGEKWECKDYFFTMDKMKEHDLDDCIGHEEVRHLLFDYQNPLIHELCLELMAVTGKLQKLKGEKPFMDKFIEDIAKKDSKNEEAFTVIKGGADD